MLGNEADALDATQDALLAAVRGLGRFDGRSSFATWLYRIATNSCIDEMRRRRRRPVTGIVADVADHVDEVSFGASGLFVLPTRGGTQAFEALWEREGGDPGSASTAGSTWSSSSGLGDRSAGAGNDRGATWARDPADAVAARVDVDAALALLPVEFRTAVVLRDVCDLPYDDIAEILSVPVGTVRSRIARARSALAATWQADHGAGGNRKGSTDVRTLERNRATASASASASPTASPTEPSRAPRGRGRLREPTTAGPHREQMTDKAHEEDHTS
jgi:RNA polymerase sigma-70 factor (ECF subfamily)